VGAIFVITLPAFTVTVTVAVPEPGGCTLVFEGIVKFLGCQLSIKKPMVLATDGSAGMVSAPGVTGVIICATGAALFLQEIKRDKAIKKKCIILLLIFFSMIIYIKVNPVQVSPLTCMAPPASVL